MIEGDGTEGDGTAGDGDRQGEAVGDAHVEVEALAGSWPRILIEAGTADSLARRWVASRRAAVAAGRPPHAHHPLSPALAAILSEIRRARRLVRGLEAAEEALTIQAQGVRRAVSSAPPAVRRVSRLLLVSADGSPRFYRNIESLIRKFGETLEVLIIPCDELELGTAAFGADNRARALLVDHKDAVARVLDCLGEFDPGPRVEG